MKTLYRPVRNFNPSKINLNLQVNLMFKYILGGLIYKLNLNYTKAIRWARVTKVILLKKQNEGKIYQDIC